MRNYVRLSFALVLGFGLACGTSDNGGTDLTEPDVAGDLAADIVVGDEVATPDVVEAVEAVEAEIAEPGLDVAEVEADQGGTDDNYTEVEVDVCNPDCTGKVCGDDKCGGLCGTCDDATKPVCKADQSECVAVACTFPTTWGKIGVVATLQTPGDAAGVALCPDFSGDGKGDNGLKALASTINPELTKAIPSSIGIIFEFVGVDDPTADNAGFKLVALIGKPTATGATTYTVDQASFDLTATSGECPPLIYFDGAKITSKALAAGPSLFTLTLPIAALGGNLTLTLQQTSVAASITNANVDATAGILAGILTKDQVDATLAKLEATCAGPNPPSLCSYLGTAKAFLPMLFDLDQNKDGKKDAASICMDFTLAGGTITGMATP